MSASPDISVVLGTYNRLPLLKLTLRSLRCDLQQILHEIIVIDGGSTDGTLDWLTEQRDIISIVQHNRGAWRSAPLERRSWGYFMNLGFKCSHGKYILMVSDDCLLVRGAAQNGLRTFDRLLAAGKRIGGLAFYWRNWPQQENYWVGLTLGNKLFVNHGLYLRQALQAVGWVDEDYYRFYHADADVCLKMWQAGYEIADCPDAFVEHYNHANLAVRESNLVSQREDWANYLRRWRGIYYDEATQNVGGWLYRSYQDSRNTAQQFRPHYIQNEIAQGVNRTLSYPSRLIRRLSQRRPVA